MTGILSLDVDTFIVGELNVLSLLEDLNVDGRNELTWAFNDKALSWLILAVFVFISFDCSDEEVLMFVEDIDVLNALFKGFSRLEEEALFSFSEFFNSPSVLAILSNRVENDTVLS